MDAPANQDEPQSMPVRELTICRNGPALPAQAILTRFGIVGMSGSGKTQTARKLAEAMMDLNQHIGIIDPTGAWWGLRSSADGLSEGYPIVVFGGEHGDVPLRPDAGTALAKIFLKKRFNAIFSMRGWPDSDVRRFTTAWLNEVNLHNEYPVHLFLDEFDIICPQAKGAHTEESRAICNTTVRRARLQAIGVTMITQNPQDADKSVLNMADTVIAMRTQGSHPVNAIKKWMGRGLSKERLGELVITLGELPTGSGWLWSPQNKILSLEEFQLCKTFDSSKTPALGEKVEGPRVMARVDIEHLSAQLAASVEEMRQDSPEFLKQTIARLRTELATARGGGREAVDMGLIEEAQAVEMELKRLRAERAELESQALTADARAQELRRELDDYKLQTREVRNRIMTALEDLARLAAMDEDAPKIQPEPESKPGRTPRNTTAPRPSGKRIAQATSAPLRPEVRLRGKSTAMLAVCVRMYPAGLTEAQVALQAGMKRNAGGFKDYKSLLRTSGLIEVRDGLWYATEQGRERVGDDAPPAPTNTAEVLELWLPRLRGKSREMLQTLVKVRGKPISYADLGIKVGMAHNAGGFKDYLSLLRTTGLVLTEGGMARVNAEALFL